MLIMGGVGYIGCIHGGHRMEGGGVLCVIKGTYLPPWHKR